MYDALECLLFLNLDITQDLNLRYPGPKDGKNNIFCLFLTLTTTYSGIRYTKAYSLALLSTLFPYTPVPEVGQTVVVKTP